MEYIQLVLPPGGTWHRLLETLLRQKPATGSYDGGRGDDPIEVTPKCGLVRESLQNALNSGLGIEVKSSKLPR